MSQKILLTPNGLQVAMPHPASKRIVQTGILILMMEMVMELMLQGLHSAQGTVIASISDTPLDLT